MRENQKRNVRDECYSLKKYSLKRWIVTHGYTQTSVAKNLGLDILEFKRKLNQREPFTREQIFTLLELVGLRDAYHIIYFPREETHKENSGE